MHLKKKKNCTNQDEGESIRVWKVRKMINIHAINSNSFIWIVLATVMLKWALFLSWMWNRFTIFGFSILNIYQKFHVFLSYWNINLSVSYFNHFNLLYLPICVKVFFHFYPIYYIQQFYSWFIDILAGCRVKWWNE